MADKMWAEFEQELRALDKKIYLWWRDDDIRAKKFSLLKWRSDLKYKKKVKTLVKLFSKYQIPAVFAIVPENYALYGQWFTKLFQKYQLKVILHGLVHQNFAPSGSAKSEFPNEEKADEDCAAIMAHYAQFQSIFGKFLLPCFCPPYNNLNPKLEEKLAHSKLIVSKANFNLNEPQDCNVDYDFCDWSICKVKPHAQILQELLALMKSDKQVIGINGHHACLHFSRGDFKFFDKLFSILAQNSNVQWFLPLL